MELRFDESSSDDYQEQSEVMTENSNWALQPLRNSNTNNSAGGKVRQKRDFRFQVIQIRQGPKWFIWPTNKEESRDVPKKNGSNQENTEVQPMEQNGAQKDQQSAQTMENSANTSTANQGQQCPATVANMQANQSQIRRTLRFSNRRKFQVQPVVESIAIEGEMTPVTSTNQFANAPLSEPTTRRLTCKPQKSTKSEPIPNSQPNDSCCSTSAPSQTFKILSISKKWDSEDEDEFLECSCRKMSLSLDDDCAVGHNGHIVAASGIHLVLTPPPESNGNRFNL